MRYIAILSIVLLFAACKKDRDEENDVNIQKDFSFELPVDGYNYADLNLPDHVANNLQLNVYANNNIPLNNLTTDEGATLGRVLFYDQRLSANNEISCGSCHKQQKAFSDPARFSEGIHGQSTARNSMSLFNMRYFRDFFWDMTADGLEEQVLLPIQHPEEMASDLDQAVDEISDDENYDALFENAFGDSEITPTRISFALSQFIRSMVSFNAKFDQGYPIDFSNYTQEELDGKDVFYSGETRCSHCHNSFNFFTRLDPVSNGLDVTPLDNGFYNETGNTSDIGKFKIVSLRNVEVTGPYMHDGRFETLEEVIDHYNTGVQPHENLDDRLTVEGEVGGTPIQMNLSDYEKGALIAFLKTLTDQQALNDVRFSNPFVVE